jgi:hypothetical protein
MSRYKWIVDNDINNLANEVYGDISEIYNNKQEMYTLNFKLKDEITVVAYMLNWGYEQIKNKKKPNNHTDRVKKDMIKLIDTLSKELLEYGLVDECYDYLMPIKKRVKELKVVTQKQYIVSLKKYAELELEELGTSTKRKRYLTRFIGDALVCIDRNPDKYKELLSPIVVAYC